ncbi:hypothetical protein V8C26DRAFT_117298 [Trichoderma gracile]
MLSRGSASLTPSAVLFHGRRGRCRAAPCRCAVGAVDGPRVPVNLWHGYLVGAVPTPRRPLNQNTPALSLRPLAPRPMAALICCLPQRLLLGQEAILLASGTEKAYYPARKYKPCARTKVTLGWCKYRYACVFVLRACVAVPGTRRASAFTQVLGKVNIDLVSTGLRRTGRTRTVDVF